MNGSDLVWLPEDPPTFERLLAPELQPLPLLPILAIVMAALYLTGAVRMWATRRRWPISRTLCFLVGCALLVVVMGSAIEGYGYLMFSVFMFQQLTLMIAVPPLLVLGSPGTLMLRATPHRGLGRLLLRLALTGLRSPVGKWLLHPALGIPLYLLSYYGLYFGSLADTLLATQAGHMGLEFFFLAAGMIFTIPVLSSDPLPMRIGHVWRLLDVFAEMALHAFFGVIVMMGTTVLVDAFANPPPSWGLDVLRDQQFAGGLAWSYGEGPTAFILIYLLHRWHRSDSAKARAADRRADAQGDHDLEAYNDYLARLRDPDRSD